MSFIIYPAIDLKGGQAVRLEQGAMDRATVFNADPADQARAFEAAGFEWLHLVDLNGAFDGKPRNKPVVEAILGTTSLPVQLGGGIRDNMTIDMWLEAGVTRVILGTIAVKDPALVRRACQRHPGRIVVGIDARDGLVATEGWAESSELSATELAKRFEGAGVASIIYTDIARDGLLGGVNVEATADLARAVSIPVIASGGLAGAEDIQALKQHPGIEGVIAGRALYDGRLTAKAALAAAK